LTVTVIQYLHVTLRFIFLPNSEKEGSKGIYSSLPLRTLRHLGGLVQSWAGRQCMHYLNQSISIGWNFKYM